MALRLIAQKRTLGFKLETTPYTAETLAVTDYVYDAYGIGYSPEIEEYTRNIAYGDYSRSVAIAGKRKATVSFSIDLHRGAAAATPPQYFAMLRACALKQVVYGATGVALISDSNYNRVPATIEVVEKEEGASPKQLVIKLRGCMGNAKLTMDSVGQPIKIAFEFTGVLNSVATRAYASLLTPTGFDTALPPAVLAATISLYGTWMFCSKIEIDLGNKIELFSDPSKAQGYEGAHVVDREMSMTIDPDMVVTDDTDWLTSQINNTTGALSITVGSNTVISAPKAQVVDAYKPADREGHVAHSMKLNLTRNVGDDEFEILQGAKA